MNLVIELMLIKYYFFFFFFENTKTPQPSKNLIHKKRKGQLSYIITSAHKTTYI